MGRSLSLFVQFVCLFRRHMLMYVERVNTPAPPKQLEFITELSFPRHQVRTLRTDLKAIFVEIQEKQECTSFAINLGTKYAHAWTQSYSYAFWRSALPLQ